MNTSLVLNAILTVFVLANIFAGWTFMSKQKQGYSFITSFDKASVGGGCFFALGSGIYFIVDLSGNLSQAFI